MRDYVMRCLDDPILREKSTCRVINRSIEHLSRFRSEMSLSRVFSLPEVTHSCSTLGRMVKRKCSLSCLNALQRAEGSSVWIAFSLSNGFVLDRENIEKKRAGLKWG